MNSLKERKTMIAMTVCCYKMMYIDILYDESKNLPLESASTFMMAVEVIQKEDAFQIESQYTCAAVNTSKALHEWWKQPTTNKERLSWFAHVLVRLKACFPCKYKSTVLRRERMWGCYQRLCTANTFVKDWQIFISKSVGLKHFHPAFYQSVTQRIFDKLIKHEHPMRSVQMIESHICGL